MSRLSEILSARGQLIGSLVSISSAQVAEALSLSTLDWLFYDLEHSTISLGEVQGMIQAMRGDCLSVIRIEGPSSICAKKALDTGCDAIIVPQVNTVEQARELVSASKYAPLGARSVGLGRALGYGRDLSVLKTANHQTALILQIEHVEGVSQAEQIASIDGVDGLFVGPFDLAASMGLAEDMANPELKRAVEQVVTSARKHGKFVGTFAGSAKQARREIGRGFALIAVGSDVARLVEASDVMRAAVEFPPSSTPQL